nr:toll/interleukin-1 receptor domain-containing protein [Anaerofilum hominis]
MYLKPTNPCRVFISHATGDLAFARALATDLLEAGYQVFLDDWSIELGEDIIAKISQGIEASKAMIPLISEAFLSSVFCRDEWTAYYMSFAKEQPDSIYPVILDDSQPPALLASKKYARIREDRDYQQFLEPLLRSLKRQSY